MKKTTRLKLNKETIIKAGIDQTEPSDPPTTVTFTYPSAYPCSVRGCI